MFEPEDMPVLAANYLARSMSISPEPDQSQLAPTCVAHHAACAADPYPRPRFDSIAPGGHEPIPDSLVKVIDSRRLPPPLMWTANT